MVLMNKTVSLWVVKRARLGDVTCASLEATMCHPTLSEFSGLVTKSHNISLKARS